MNRIATFTVSTIVLAVVTAAPAAAIPVPPDAGSSADAGQVPLSHQRGLTDFPHRMPYLFRVGPDYLP